MSVFDPWPMQPTVRNPGKDRSVPGKRRRKARQNGEHRD